MSQELDTEADGFNDDDDDETSSATETPRDDDDDDAPSQQAQAEAVAEQVIEYAQLTRAEWDEWKARAAKIDEIKATQDKSFGTIGNTIRGLQDQLKAAQSGAQVEILQEDIDALKDDFPPLAAALEKVRNMRAIPVGGFDQAKVEELVGPRLKAAEQKFELRLLARDHPDWQQIDASPEFRGYVQGLPEAERKQLADASDNFDSDVVSRFISRFKATKPATTRKSRFDAAVTPRGSGVTHNAVGSDEKSGFDSA